MQEITTFYPPKFEQPPSHLASFSEKLRNFSLELQKNTIEFNLEEFYDFLWVYWAKPDLKFLQSLIELAYQKVYDVRSNQCPLQELIELISSLETITSYYASEEKKKKETIYVPHYYRQEICKPLQDSIASVILENQPDEVKAHFQNASFKEQQKLLQNISYSSNSSQALFLQFCSEIFSNMDSITELLYKNHYNENSEE